MAATITTELKQAVAGIFGGSGLAQARYLVLKDSTGGTAKYWLVDKNTGVALLADASPPRVTASGQILTTGAMATPFAAIHLLGDVGTHSIRTLEEATALCTSGIAALTPYIMASETISVAFTAGDYVSATGVLKAGS